MKLINKTLDIMQNLHPFLEYVLIGTGILLLILSFYSRREYKETLDLYTNSQKMVVNLQDRLSAQILLNEEHSKKAEVELIEEQLRLKRLKRLKSLEEEKDQVTIDNIDLRRQLEEANNKISLYKQLQELKDQNTIIKIEHIHITDSQGNVNPTVKLKVNPDTNCYEIKSFSTKRDSIENTYIVELL